MTFSRRANWKPLVNRLSAARDAYRGELFDLTQSNPTRANLEYPLDELAVAMTRAARAPYDPDPLGLRSAREILGDADNVVITASTSEAYAFLFKLLCDAGDNVVVATPSYPLFEHLAGLELIELRTFPLEFHRRWELHAERVRDAVDSRTRAIVVVNPNNPTGSFVTPAEQSALAQLGLPIIIDEVFLDYGQGAPFDADSVLTFRLGGLSKSCGLPHYKLAWIAVRGPRSAVRDAMAGLELIADNYLSVATPVQSALQDLLRIGTTIRERIRQRIARNRDALRTAVHGARSATLLPVEGGWSAVLRVPSTTTDEEFALRLLNEHGVIIHPGYFFDFERDGYFVVSLLTDPAVFDDGIERLVSMIPA